MATALLFLLFTIGFAYLMNEWSRDLDDLDAQDEAEIAPIGSNVVVGSFGRTTETKRAA